MKSIDSLEASKKPSGCEIHGRRYCQISINLYRLRVTSKKLCKTKVSKTI